MTIRFSETDKWRCRWFRSLLPDSKLLYLLTYDNCDVAGFMELDEEEIQFRSGLTPRRIQGAIEGLTSILETNGQFIWIPDFIIQQKNWPLNPKNNAHIGILRLLSERESFSPQITKYLNGEGLPSPFIGANQGLFSSTSKGISTSKGLGKGKSHGKDSSYSSDFESFWTIFKKLRRAEAKPKTLEHWNATITGRDGETGHPPIPASAIIIAAKNYRDYCVANKTERQYIMQSASFVGPKKRGWEAYMEPIETETQKRDERLREWAGIKEE